MEYRERQFSAGGLSAAASKIEDFFFSYNEVEKEAYLRAHLNAFRLRTKAGHDITKMNRTWHDEILEGPAGPFSVRVYETASESPLLVFAHGGGFCFGTFEACHYFCKAVAEMTGITVLSVEYHLAPEFPYPAGLEDLYLTAKWGIKNAESLRIDRKKVIISGDSAGGNLAAVCALLAKERKDLSFWKQMLLYPVTDLSLPTDHSGFRQITKRWYAGKQDLKHFCCSPLRHPDLSQLPDALIVVCEEDIYQQEGISYAKALSDAGNKVTCLMYKHTKHAFIETIGMTPQAEDLIGEIDAWTFENHL